MQEDSLAPQLAELPLPKAGARAQPQGPARAVPMAGAGTQPAQQRGSPVLPLPRAVCVLAALGRCPGQHRAWQAVGSAASLVVVTTVPVPPFPTWAGELLPGLMLPRGRPPGSAAGSPHARSWGPAAHS